MRLSGVQRIEIHLQTNRVTLSLDPTRRFSPSRVWKEIRRIGFTPDRLEVWAEGVYKNRTFVVDGTPWPIQGQGPGERHEKKEHFRVVDGSQDPPTVVPLGG